MHRPQKNQLCCYDGFTLIELVMTIVILSASSLILIPFFNAITHSPDPIMRSRAVALGQSMIDEIMSKKWDEQTDSGGGPIITGETADSVNCAPANRIACFRDSHPGYTPGTSSASLGPDSETRAAFDDVDDYNGLNVTDGIFQDESGLSFTLDRYQRKVEVRYISSASTNISHSTTAAPGTTDSKLIVVTVTSPTNEVFYLVAVTCNL